jgi:hypothetical protein
MTTAVTARAPVRGPQTIPNTQPFESDVKVWRSPPPESEIWSNIPWSVIQHSPDGFECGYAGSGPADLALNILNAFVPPRAERIKDWWESDTEDDPLRVYHGIASRFAVRWHQKFKREFIATMPRSGGKVSGAEIRDWIARHRAPFD